MNFSARAGLVTDLPPARRLERGGMGLLLSEYPAEQPWMKLLVSHGFAEHRGWYDHLARTLQAQGISTFVFDHFHHGRSDGESAAVPRYGVLVEGLLLALEQGVGANRQLPLALVGHSNGALIILHALRRIAAGAVSRVVLSSPLLGLAPPLGLLEKLPLWLARWLPVGARIPLRPFPDRLTADPSVWEDYRRDPLRFRSVSLRFLAEMGRASRQARRRFDCLGVPLLLLCGELDRVVNPAATRAWFQRLRDVDKRMIVYRGLRHELFNETQWQTVVGDMVAWLREGSPE
ncbi:MAG: alpha/beta fold hydrolase [SAR324 cluster bacterium]|nr:alpha/beta fold hydrolase [SAR324 cluster bacterium]